MYGEYFDLSKDSEILSIKSPKEHVGGPYKVVYKDVIMRWAIVAMDWDNEPRLGMRWFWKNGGNPFSSGYPTWFVIPPSLTKSILAGLTIDHKFSSDIDKFLSKEFGGKELEEKYPNNKADGF